VVVVPGEEPLCPLNRKVDMALSQYGGFGENMNPFTCLQHTTTTTTDDDDDDDDDNNNNNNKKDLPTPYSRALLENLKGFQLVKKFPPFMDPEGSLPQ
jgi:hypothetical protein